MFYYVQKAHSLLSLILSQVKLSFIVILPHVGTYSGIKRRASQDHGAYAPDHYAMIHIYSVAKVQRQDTVTRS